jgi:hypothetical protein
MPAELTDLVAELKSVVDMQKAIAGNTGVDAIDLSTLAVSVESLANDAFMSSNVSMATLIALRDAYDFVASMARLGSIYGATRLDYYEGSSDQLDKLIAYVDFFKSIINNLENMGN